VVTKKRFKFIYIEAKTLRKNYIPKARMKLNQRDLGGGGRNSILLTKKGAFCKRFGPELFQYFCSIFSLCRVSKT